MIDGYRYNPSNLADRIRMQAQAERWNIANVPGYLQRQTDFVRSQGGDVGRYMRDVYSPDTRANGGGF
jgi:hypothetical protein